jgi:hypothetical protein
MFALRKLTPTGVKLVARLAGEAFYVLKRPGFSRKSSLVLVEVIASTVSKPNALQERTV